MLDTVTAKPVTTNNQKILPPAPVIWAWLYYIFQTTGEWLMPPQPEAASETAPDNPTGSGQVANNKNPVSYQFPFPNMISYAAIAPGLEPKPSQKPGRGHTRNLARPRFEYSSQSPWLAEARRVSQGKNLELEVIVTLAFLICWCCFPLFRQMRERPGGWMTLALDRAARELGIRPQKFMEHVSKLEELGLVKRGRAGQGDDPTVSNEDLYYLRQDVKYLGSDFGGGGGGFWGRASIQTRSTFYRLLFVPNPELPDFNPFRPNSNGGGKDVMDYQLSFEQAEKSTGKDVEAQEKAENSEKRPETEPGRSVSDPDGLPTSFPSSEQVTTCMYDFKHECMYEASCDFSKKEALQEQTPKISTNGTSCGEEEASEAVQKQQEKAIAALPPLERSKFDFLHKEASFPNFATKQGAQTLDVGECLKFARSDLTLVQIKEIYSHTLEEWESGNVRQTPLGLMWKLLHKTLEKGKTGDYERTGTPGTRRPVVGEAGRGSQESIGPTERAERTKEDLRARAAEYNNRLPPL